eukprot:364661-Chlamydomonas_euryale.AAC.8
MALRGDSAGATAAVVVEAAQPPTVDQLTHMAVGSGVIALFSCWRFLDERSIMYTSLCRISTLHSSSLCRISTLHSSSLCRISTLHASRVLVVLQHPTASLCSNAVICCPQRAVTLDSASTIYSTREAGSSRQPCCRT